MFIALVRFPDVPTDRDGDFRDWFDWSNQQLAATSGLRGRRLLHAAGVGYSALVEHESAASFSAMHDTPVAADIQARLSTIVSGAPKATTFDVVAELAGRGCCMADGGNRHDDHDHHPERQSAPAAPTALAVEQACCHAG